MLIIYYIDDDIEEDEYRYNKLGIKNTEEDGINGNNNDNGNNDNGNDNKMKKK